MELKRFFYYLLGAFVIRSSLGYMRVCYFTNWSQFAPNYQFSPARVLPRLCTHIIFAYADIRATNVVPTEFNDVAMYSRLNRLKQGRPSLQIILAVGGWAAGGEKFSRLVSSEAAMSQFADNLVTFTRRNSLDGINIDWEYPTANDRGSDVIDRERYTRFLQIVRQTFEDEAISSRRPRLSLSAALETDMRDAVNYYQIAEIGKYLDFACLMAYDMHGQWDYRLGALHHSALNPEIRTNVLGWIQAGFPAEKLVLGVSGFGRSFILAGELTGNGLGQPVAGGGTAGSFSRESGLLDYGEICQYIVRDGWTRIWLEDRGVPVAFGNTSSGWQWVGYDDPQSMTLKSIFIRQQGLAGVMFWSLEHDDFTNLCNNGSWPLLRTLSRELPSNSSLAPPTPTSTQSPSTTTTATISTRSSISSSESLPLPESQTSTATDTFLYTSNEPPSSSESTTTAVKQEVADAHPNTNKMQQTAVSRSRGTETRNKKIDRSLKKNIKENHRKDYRQCKMADVFGPSLSCPATKGKPGDKYSFYLFCFPGFLAIECRCLPGNFFNRCLQKCDLDENFKKCPFVH